MKKIIIIGLFLLSISQIFAQNQSDSIEIKKTIGIVYRQNGKILSYQQLLSIMQGNTEAHKEMKASQINHSFGFIFGCAGGFMIGWPIGTTIGGGKANWVLAGIGVGLAIVSIPFSATSSRQAKNAVKIYNQGLKQTGMNSFDVKLRLTPEGIGLTMAF